MSLKGIEEALEHLLRHGVPTSEARADELLAKVHSAEPEDAEAVELPAEAAPAPAPENPELKAAQDRIAELEALLKKQAAPAPALELKGEATPTLPAPPEVTG
jgi:hypothetical protein